MNTSSRSMVRRLAARTAVAVAAVAACSAASALPAFTFNPAAVGLTGTAFTADNLIVSDYATVTTSGGGFTETGVLNLTSAQLGGSPSSGGGLGTTYGLYIAFQASGTTTYTLPVGGGITATGGTVDTLSYSLMGYNGASIVTPGVTPAGAIILGGGSIVAGPGNTFSSTASGSTVVQAGLGATLNFAPSASKSAFFQSPTPFYSLAGASFINFGAAEITTTAGGFNVTNGGGSANFLATPVPEPETYALMLGGLAAVGFVARRRSNG